MGARREVRAAPEATFSRLRLFGSGFSNSSWSWVAPEGAGCPEGYGRRARRSGGSHGRVACVAAPARRGRAPALCAAGGARGAGGSAAEEAAALTGEWRALLRLRAEAAPALGAAGRACGAGRLAAEEEAPPWALGLGRRGCWRWRPWRGAQLSALALSPAEV